jgi:uncharacterized membrane protein YecN with MAPEG domain
MQFAVFCIGMLGLLVVGLGFGVSMQRRSSGTIIGCKDDPSDPLYKWMRAHGNACEFAPILAILIYALASTGHGGWNGWLYFAAVLFRYLHAAGMILSPTLSQPQPLRFAGAVGTYTVGFLLALMAIF